MNAVMFLVDVAVKGTVVLLAALVAARLMRRWSAAARHATWSVALAAMLALPAFSMLVPAWRVLPAWTLRPPEVRTLGIPYVVRDEAVLTDGARAMRGEDSATAGAPDAHAATVKGNSIAGGGARTEAMSSRSIEWHSLLMPLYLAGLIAAFAPIGGGVVALLIAERRARRITGGTWAGLMEEIRAGFSIRRKIVLLESESATAMPMTWGLLRPRVLVPARSEEWSVERHRVVLLHEAAHVKRGDWLTHLLCRLACCVYWFHPLAWYAAAQARLEAEHACDDAVMAVGARSGREAVKPSTYASELLTLAGAYRAAPMQCAGAIAMARRESGQLQVRIRAILDSARNRQGFSGRRLALALLLALAGAIPLSALRGATPAETAPGDKSPSVLVVVSPTGISFQGKPTTWEELPGLLEKVSDREKTVLAFALTTDQMTVKVRDEAVYRLAKLCKDDGFRYLSDTGIQSETTGSETHATAESGTLTFQGANARLTMDHGKTQVEAEKITITVPGQDMWSPEHFQPVVVRSLPESGAMDVPSSTTEVRVTFSKEMMANSYSWCQFSKESFPKMAGDAHYVDGHTCVLPVKLEPHHHYAIGLNTPPYSNFQDVERRPAQYYVVTFDTGD